MMTIQKAAMEEYRPGWYQYEFSKIANLDFYIADSKGIEIKKPDKTDFIVNDGKYWITKDGILYERDPLVKEVDSITVEPGYSNVKLKWTMADTEGVSGFEIQYINEKKVTKKVQAIKKEEREYLIEGLEPLDTLTITIKIVKGSELSVGKTQKVLIPHKNVVADEFMGKRMFVYLPDGYNESTEKYPVMYMFDGQNIFSKAYVATEWGVDETLDKLIKDGKVQKMIVVGLFHAGDKRAEEYTAYDFQLGRDFAENLSKKFIPYIEEKYRVLSGKENRGLMGSSRGGLAALYLINNYDEYFGFAAGVSPSEKWKFAEYKNFQKKDVRIWIDNGTADYVLGYARSPACREMVDGYITQGHTYGDSVAFYEVKDSVHNETDWSKRVAYPFIMFKGIKTAKVTDFNISIEVFHDDKNNAICAANPVADYDNGFRMSLYSLAEYAISGKATIDKKGIFMLNEESEAEITIKYEGITKMIKITATEIEAMRRKNLSSK